MPETTATAPLTDCGHLTEKVFLLGLHPGPQEDGLLYLGTTLLFLLVGGIFALLLRAKLMYPGQELFSDKAYNVFFTLHGIMMIFLLSFRPSLGAGVLLHPTDGRSP